MPPKKIIPQKNVNSKSISNAKPIINKKQDSITKPKLDFEIKRKPILSSKSTSRLTSKSSSKFTSIILKTPTKPKYIISVPENEGYEIDNLLEMKRDINLKLVFYFGDDDNKIRQVIIIIIF
jgi:hypothetical protein